MKNYLNPQASNLGLSVIFLSAALSGCSHSPQQAQQQWEAERLEVQAESAEQTLDDTPDWFIQVPEPDAQGFYAVGTAYSASLQHAVNKAKLQAEFNLAKIYSQQISGSETDYVSEDSGREQFNSRSEVTVDKLVKRANIVGYSVKQQKILQEKGGFRAYVQLFYPYAEFNRVKREAAGQEASQTSDLQSAREALHQKLQD